MDEFEWLARTNPGELVRLMVTDLRTDAVLLAQAAQAMAHSHAPSLVAPALLDLLRHERPFVRESALIGIAPLLSGALEARDRVREIEASDPSPGVREAAEDVLALL